MDYPMGPIPDNINIIFWIYAVLLLLTIIYLLISAIIDVKSRTINETKLNKLNIARFIFSISIVSIYIVAILLCIVLLFI